MRKFISIIIILLLCSNVYAQWESRSGTAAQSVDMVPLDRGYYTSAATVTSSVSAIPLYGNFTDRHSMVITNSDDYNSVYIVSSPSFDSVDAGYELLANSSLSLDIGDDATDSTIWTLTSDSTISVSVSTIEVR